MEPPADPAPPTIVVVHPRENRRKCSVEPLRAHANFVFWKFPERGPEPLDGYVRLAIGGPLLSKKDARSGLLVLDGTWRLERRMAPFFEDVPVRSLPEWVTAYPRTSKSYPDTRSGLATIEAIFAAFVATGRPTAGLLDRYRWAELFMERNRARLAPAS